MLQFLRHYTYTMLSASVDFVPLNPWQRASLEAYRKWSKNSSEIHTYKFKMSSSSGDFVPLSPSESLTWSSALGPHWSKLPDHFTARSTTLAQILPSYIIPSRSLRSSSTTISAPLRKTSIATSRSSSSTASDVWDKLPVHVSSASTLPVFRRQALFILSCLPWIQYTDHQSRNLSQ